MISQIPICDVELLLGSYRMGMRFSQNAASRQVCLFGKLQFLFIIVQIRIGLGQIDQCKDRFRMVMAKQTAGQLIDFILHVFLALHVP